MNAFLVIIVSLAIIIIIFKNKIRLRREIRKIINENPNTIRHLKNKTFKEHELIKSLKGKIYDALSGSKHLINRTSLDKIIDQEISKEIKGWKKRLFKYIGVTGITFCICVIVMLVLSEDYSDKKVSGKEVTMSKINSFIEGAKSYIKKYEFSEVKQDLEQVTGKINEENRRKNEEYFNTGITYMKNGQFQSAISLLEKIDKDSGNYEEAQEHLKIIKRNLYMKESKDIDYKELQKKPEEFKGKIIHLYGRIYNIQEVNGKTILSLSTTQDKDEVHIGKEALILFQKVTPLNEGDYIQIYGEMLGNYSKNYNEISNFIKSNKHNIYFDQRTFIEQVPVIKVKIIQDLKQNIHEG
ncbi:hypothetical protein [Bacillus cereus group sp. BfR-BA-01309]|uniref:hypothetical protein n=1 Tax=Bacillus cereus group sp. BfR-BA-01309 TaxID=2920286 RepID=UPI001F564F7D|nr:hypothetical protein [Bacillus cereus group sp. BfR-BA-01309]